MSDEPDPDFDLETALNESTLTGDIRDVLLGHMRSWQDPWAKLNERQQEDKIRICTNLAEDLVRRAVLLVSNRGLPHLIVEVGKITLDKGIKIDVTAANITENRHAIGEHGKRPAILVLASMQEFNGARSQPKAEPDQRALQLGKEYTQGDGEGFDDPETDPNEPATDGDDEFPETPDGGEAVGNDATHLLGADDETPAHLQDEPVGSGVDQSPMPDAPEPPKGKRQKEMAH